MHQRADSKMISIIQRRYFMTIKQLGQGHSAMIFLDF